MSNIDLDKPLDLKADKITKVKEIETDIVVSVTSIKPLDQDAVEITTQDRLASLWKMPNTVLQEAEAMANMVRMSHGMLASVPLLCKGPQCVYKDVCTISPANRLLGMRCPMEGAALISRFEQYCLHFGIDISTPNPYEGDIVDLTLIKDLVDIELQMLRADNKIALSGDFISLTIGSVDNKGRVYYEETVSVEAEWKLKLMDKKFKILNQLDSTRKDKSSKLKSTDDASVKAATIFSNINQMLADKKKQEALQAEEVEFNIVEPIDITDQNTEGGE